jgi:uncharacterized protein DUF3616
MQVRLTSVCFSLAMGLSTITAHVSDVVVTTSASQFEVTTYVGMCDASGAAPLSSEHFLVANDEDNDLRIYRHGESRPVASFPMSEFLGVEKNGKGKPREADLEGAAMLRDAHGDVIFWVGSHGRDKDRELQPSRWQLFATRVSATNGQWQVQPEGHAYRRLLEDLVKADIDQQWRFGLQAAAELRPEDHGGLNIEALAASNSQLLVGFRNPLPSGNAIVVPIENPFELVRSNAHATFGKPMQLALKDRGGRPRGVRDMYRLSADLLLVLAGSANDDGDFSLYAWTGRPGDIPMIRSDIAFPDGSSPEALYVSGEYLHVLSDDGDRPVINSADTCKKQKTPESRTFRELRLSIPEVSTRRITDQR